MGKLVIYVIYVNSSYPVLPLYGFTEFCNAAFCLTTKTGANRESDILYPF